MGKGLRGGLPIFWHEMGQGTRPALLLHCTLAHSGVWKPVARELDAHLRMTAFDMPGHGKSGPWREDREIQGQVVAVAQSFLDGPSDLVGHSFGAAVALRLAVERPELVRSLTLIEPVFIAAGLAEAPEMAEEYDKVIDRIARLVQTGDRMGAARTFHEDWSDGRAWEDIDPDLRRGFAQRIHIVPKADDMLRHDAAGLLRPGRLERLEIPSLIIDGAETVPIMGHVCRGLARRIPNARAVTIAGAGHMVALTHPGEVAAEIIRLLGDS